MKITDQPELCLETLGGGAAREKFQAELEKVLKNIADPNAADGKREIVLKVVITPNAKRSSCDVDIFTSCKLQADVPYSTNAFIGRVGARHAAWEHNPDQMRLPMSSDDIQGTPSQKVIGGQQ
jgi:hypothetical protein